MDRRPCPYHAGSYDCTPFCEVCEGSQEYDHTETRPCRDCGAPVDTEIWFEELQMCVDCSHAYFSEVG